MVPMPARLTERRPTAPVRAWPCSNHSIRLGIWYRSQTELAKQPHRILDRNVRQLAKKSIFYDFSCTVRIHMTCFGVWHGTTRDPYIDTGRINSISASSHRKSSANHNIGPQTENRLKKLIMIWRALHEYVNFVHDPEKQYRSLLACWNPGVIVDQDRAR